MKFFIGRSQTFWVVHPKTGTVRKLPFSSIGLGVLFLLLISCSTLFAALTIDRYTGGLVAVTDVFKNRWILKEKENLLEKTKTLETTVAALQRQNEEAKRLNARVENKLYDLEGILGSVGEQKKASNEKITAKSLFKPASLSIHEPESIKSVTIAQQRRTLQKLDHIVRQLKGLPLSSPVPGGIITSRFGYRQSPFGHDSRFHYGVDISLSGNASVRTAGAGVVRSIGVNSGYGLVVDIQHSRNVVTRYAHLALAKVRVGQRVNTGELIAYGGSSGRATGRHLHYEVRVRGRAQNPEVFMNLSRQIHMVLKGGQTRRG